MWDEILRALERYDNAVLTGFDEDGFPFSVRCVPSAQPQEHRIGVEVPQQSGIQPGRASLLMHSHNEELWDLTSVLIRGTLVHSRSGWYLAPASVQGNPEVAGMVEQFKSLFRMRKTAGRYLERRNIDRPKVPWTDIQRLQREAAELRRQQRQEA
jgi:hypothetical protein